MRAEAYLYDLITMYYALDSIRKTVCHLRIGQVTAGRKLVIVCDSGLKSGFLYDKRRFRRSSSKSAHNCEREVLIILNISAYISRVGRMELTTIAAQNLFTRW